MVNRILTGAGLVASVALGTRIPLPVEFETAFCNQCVTSDGQPVGSRCDHVDDPFPFGAALAQQSRKHADPLRLPMDACFRRCPSAGFEGFPWLSPACSQ